MSDTVLMTLIALELAGLVGLFLLARMGARRRKAGKERPPRWLRISAALFALVVVVGFPVLMVLAIINPSRQHESAREELVQSGTPATGTITQVEETGTVINRRPQVQVWVEVEPEGGGSFVSQSTWTFSVSDTQTYRVGTRVNVYYDPDDHDTVAIVGVAPAPE